MEAVPNSLVSIIMPNFNGAEYLAEAISSVQNQTYRNWELLIVDDASTDCSVELISEIESHDFRVKLFRNSENQGVVKSRNIATSRALGGYIAFLDSDDIWESNKLELQLARFCEESCHGVFSSYYKVDFRGRRCGLVTPPRSVEFNRMLEANYIGNLTGVYSVDKLGKLYFKEYGHEDYVLWLDALSQGGKACSVKQPLASYRVHRGSLSSNKFDAARWQWKIYRQYLQFGLLKSAFYFLLYFKNALVKRAL